MSNNSKGRQYSSISRSTVDSDRVEKLPSWLDNFAKTYSKKEAVHSIKDDHGLFDQINTIISGRTRYTSVSEAVKDYQEKTGLKEYLNNIQASEEEAASGVKNTVANVGKPEELALFSIPGFKEKILDFIQERHGHTSIPVVLDYIGKIFQKHGIAKELHDDALKLFINRVITQEKMQHPIHEDQDTGGLSAMRENTDLDPSNDDALHACTPVRI